MTATEAMLSGAVAALFLAFTTISYKFIDFLREQLTAEKAEHAKTRDKATEHMLENAASYRELASYVRTNAERRSEMLEREERRDRAGR